jgi:hypothetical protein
MNTQRLIRELIELGKVMYVQIDVDYSEKIGRGYSRETINSAIKIHPIPESLISIYSCIGGDSADFTFTQSLIAPYYYLIELDSINEYIDMYLASRNEIIEKIGEEEYSKWQDWEPDMIPFLDQGSGYTIFVRTLPGDESIWRSQRENGMEKIHSNIDSFLQTAIELYRQGVYYRDSNNEGVWDANWDRAIEIVRQIDPEIENYSPP